MFQRPTEAWHSTRKCLGKGLPRSWDLVGDEARKWTKMLWGPKRSQKTVKIGKGEHHKRLRLIPIVTRNRSNRGNTPMGTITRSTWEILLSGSQTPQNVKGQWRIWFRLRFQPPPQGAKDILVCFVILLTEDNTQIWANRYWSDNLWLGNLGPGSSGEWPAS